MNYYPRRASKMRFTCLLFLCLHEALSSDDYTITKVKKQKEKLYIRFSNYGSNTEQSCQSVQVTRNHYKYVNVTYRVLDQEQQQLKCYKIKMNISTTLNKTGYNNLLTFATFNDGCVRVRERKIIYADPNNTCWVFKDTKTVNKEGQNHCELLTTEGTSNIPVPQGCQSAYEENCGCIMEGCFVPNCTQYEDDEATCGPRPTTPGPTPPPVTVPIPDWCPRFGSTG